MTTLIKQVQPTNQSFKLTERANVKFLSSLPVGGLGLDFVHDNGYNLKQIESGDFDSSKTLYAGIIDGRNV